MAKEISSQLINLKRALNEVNAEDLTKDSEVGFNFSENKAMYYSLLLRSSLRALEENSSEVKDKEFKALIKKLDSLYEKKDLKGMRKTVEDLMDKAGNINISKEIRFYVPELPREILDEVKADVKEVEKCFNAGAYRSAAILCGRILEIALHRKYYEITKNDLLEKSPGIGLGKIIAKLKELDIEIEPGLMQQIHLINNVRINSVHSSKKAYYPSKEQGQAIILYTLDALKKMF
jgi:hypothetical protein